MSHLTDLDPLVLIGRITLLEGQIGSITSLGWEGDALVMVLAP
jgi:hypothetical protein